MQKLLKIKFIKLGKNYGSIIEIAQGRNKNQRGEVGEK